VRKGGEWSVVGPIERIAMPTSVRERLRGGLAALTEDERSLVEVLAVAGGEGDAELLAGILDRQVLGVLRDLGRLERLHGLVRSGRRGFTLDDDRIGEVLLEEAPPEMVRHLHGRIAEVLAGELPEPETAPPEQALMLARHLVEAERWDRALAFLPKAVAHLESLRRHDDVISMTGRALEAVTAGTRCDPGVPTLLGLARARALRHVGRAEEERHELERLSRSASTTFRCRVSLELAWSSYRVGDLDAAMSSATVAHQDAQSAGDDEVERDSLRCLGAVAFAGGRLTEATQCLESALDLCMAARDQDGEAAILRTLAMVRAGFGDHRRARHELERALKICRHRKDRAGEAACLGNLALVRQESGDMARARADHLDALELFREIGDRDGEARALGNLALAEEALGLLEEALLHHRQAAARLESLADRRGLAVTLTNLGLLLEGLGRYDPAAEELREALDIARELGDDGLGATALGALGVVARAQGDLGAAIEALTAAITVLGEMSAWREAAFVQCDLARVLASAGLPQEAGGQLEAAAGLAEAGDDEELATAVLEAEVDVRFRAGDLQTALDAYAELPETTGSTPRDGLRRALRTGIARLELGRRDARPVLQRCLADAIDLSDPGPAILARVALALTGREDPGVLDPLRVDAPVLQLEDRLLACWMGHRLEREDGREEGARELLEAAYYLMHRTHAGLPEEIRDAFFDGFPQREIVEAWESAGLAVG
jgi:tetratricopeptide (TPR) repeat protein